MRHVSMLFCGVMLAVFCGFSAGCASYRVLQIEPVGKKGTVIAPTFQQSYYYFDRDLTLYFVMRSATTDKATGKPLEQVATVRVFWRPEGGRTSMNNTSLNATYRYVLMTPDSVGMYEGSGFVRLPTVEASEAWDLFGKYSGANFVGLIDKIGKSTLRARLMDGDLRLTEASANFVDTLGRAKIRGNFSAVYDDKRALDMLLAAHREFFARSLVSKPTAASTEPGAARDDDWAPGEAAPAPAGVATPPESAPAPTAHPVTRP